MEREEEKDKNEMMNRLIIGANGMVGRKFFDLCRTNDIDCIGTRFSREKDNLILFNLLETENIPAFLDDIDPGIIINCAGLAGGVDYCEQHPDITSTFYVKSTEMLVEWCKKKEVPLVFVSTDCVFDGRNPPYSEEDQTNPLNFFGRCKLEAEDLIQQNLQRFIIIRTTNVYDWDPKTKTPNFIMQLYRSLKENQPIKVPTFLFATPAFAEDLASAVEELLKKQVFGLFHLVGEEYVNRFDWALRFCLHAGFDSNLLEKMEQPRPGMAPRPLLSHLKAGKFSGISSYRFRTVDEGLQLFVKNMRESPVG